MLDLIGGLLLGGKHQLAEPPGSATADASGQSIKLELLDFETMSICVKCLHQHAYMKFTISVDAVLVK